MKDLTDLSRFRLGATPTPPWATPVFFASGHVLAFDQSLSATGWVRLWSSPDSGLRVLAAGSVLLHAKDFPAGSEGSLRKAVDLHGRMAGVCKDWLWPETVLVHEAPPAGGAMSRPESSLMAALSLRLAAGREPVVVQNQHSKKVLVNNANATKKQWHTALDAISIEGRNLVRNEGERDALCLALTYLYDEMLRRRDQISELASPLPMRALDD